MKTYEYNLSSNINIIDFEDMKKKVKEEVREQLDNIPFSRLQTDSSLKRYDAGKYYKLANDDGSYIAIVQTVHSTNIVSRIPVNTDYVYKAIFYEIFTNEIIFKYHRDDKYGSTFDPKMYVNRPVSPKEKDFYYNIDEVRPLLDEIFAEIEKYEGIDDIINIEKYRENVEKYLEGIKRR